MKRGVDYSPYAGEWVVVCGDKVVAHDANLRKLEPEIKKCKTIPTLTKVPKEEVLIF